MSVYGDASMDGWNTRELGTVEREVATFLGDAARSGSVFVKSAKVADECDLSKSRAGQAVALLARESTVLDIERWTESNSNATWRVRCTGPTPFGRECRPCETIVPEDAETCPHCGREVRR